MNSVEHAAIGTVVAGAGAAALAGAYAPATVAGLWLAGVVGSVLIDLDHFPIAWLVGDREAVGRALTHPWRTLTDPEFVFEAEFPWLRIASHLLIGGTLAAAAWTVDGRLAGFVAAVVAAHVLADVLRDQKVL